LLSSGFKRRLFNPSIAPGDQEQGLIAFAENRSRDSETDKPMRRRANAGQADERGIDRLLVSKILLMSN